MTKTFHLAVLETDTPFPAVQAVRGSYGDIFQDLFSRALEAAGLKDDVVIQVSKWDVVSERNYPQMQDVDGILLTGSSKKEMSFPSFYCVIDKLIYRNRGHGLC